MAALDPAVEVADVTHVVPAEEIDDYIQGPNFAVRVAEMIAWAQPTRGSVAKRFPRWSAAPSVPASTKTETDAATDIQVATAEGSVTPAIVPFRVPISDEAAAGFQAGRGLPAEIIDIAIEALLERMDTDALAVSTGATNTTGAATDNFGMAKFRAALATYRGLKIRGGPMGHGLVVQDDGARDLHDSMASSSSPFVKTQADSIRFGPSSGWLGTLSGVQVFSSPNVAAEAPGWSGFFTPIGFRQAGIAIGVTEAPNVRITRGDDAETRAVTYAVFRAWYGTGLINPDRVLEVLHRT